MENLKQIIYKTIGRSLPCREAIAEKNYEDLPTLELVVPNGEIQMRHIAPYDEDMKLQLTKYFPPRLKVKNLAVGQRPRSLSFHPGCHDPAMWNATDGEMGYAMSISLYEEDMARAGHTVGDPIADCAAVVCSRNTVIMVCADGCGWGEAPTAAARTAVLSALSYLTDSLLCADVPTKSADVFCFLAEAVDTVQRDLIRAGGKGMTTLCATVIVPLIYSTPPDKQWVVCNVRVGDTATYRYCKTSNHLSVLSHNIDSLTRDMRDCGGCLGPVVGAKPDLENLLYSLSIVDNNSTVFLATDGVGDNFNPYVTRQLSVKDSLVKCSDFDLDNLVHKVYCSCCNGADTLCDLNEGPRHKDLVISISDLSTHNAHCTCNMENVETLCPTLVHILSLKYFQQTIKSYYQDSSITVKDFVISICRMLVQSTDKKRTAMCRFKKRLSTLDSEEAKQLSHYHRKYVKTLPGKLDHASLVAVNLARMADAATVVRTGSPRSPRSVLSGISPVFSRAGRRVRSDFGLRPRFSRQSPSSDSIVQNVDTDSEFSWLADA